MESPEVQKLRHIPESRIKKLETSYIVEPYNKFNVEFVHQQMLETMGKEIAHKLFEFRKISVEKRTDGTVCYTTSVEVIVPPTPENAINAQPQQPSV